MMKGWPIKKRVAQNIGFIKVSNCRAGVAIALRGGDVYALTQLGMLSSTKLELFSLWRRQMRRHSGAPVNGMNKGQTNIWNQHFNNNFQMLHNIVPCQDDNLALLHKANY